MDANAQVRTFLLVDPQSGVSLPTGETLRHIQDRVLPIGATINGVRIASDDTRAPLYTSTAGWVKVSASTGVQIGEGSEVVIACENVGTLRTATFASMDRASTSLDDHCISGCAGPREGLRPKPLRVRDSTRRSFMIFVSSGTLKPTGLNIASVMPTQRATVRGIASSL